MKEALIIYDIEDTLIDGVIVCNNYESILDFIHQLNPSLKKTIYSSLEQSPAFGVLSFTLNNGHLVVYKRGSVEETSVFLFDDPSKMIEYLNKHPIHKTDNSKIIELIEKY